MRASLVHRKLHRIGAVLVAVPLLVVVVTGIVLQLKKDVAWIQPPTATGTRSDGPAIPFDRILEAARGVPEAAITGWDDVDRLDVRPARGIVKVRGKAGIEVQVDTDTAEVLQVAVRRSDWIESLHDGSWFHDAAKLWIFLPTAFVLLGLWVTGLWLWWLPHRSRRRRRRRGTG